MITHAVRSISEIKGYQAIQNGEHIKLNVMTTSDKLTKNTIEVIRNNLKKIHPYFHNIQIEQVVKLNQTIAGKTPIVLRR